MNMKGLERYKKIKNLGEGAQGNVVLSEDTLLGRKVAIKSLHQSLISDALHVKRFEEEAKTLANLRHAHIIDVYDIIANNEGCHLVMEYFEGYPLDLYIRNKTGPIPEKKAVDIFIKILDAMNYIHKKKIIHRDIKPSNIMINDDFEIRLLDFGIAKNTEKDAKLTQIGGSAGYTPMYMSPEHCNGVPITKCSDIYSLGVTLWQMLTGKAPYEGFTQGQIYLKVANEPLPSVQSVYQNVSLKMNEIVQKATRKKPNERYSSCGEFKKELSKLKKHLHEPKTEFIYNLNIKILDGIEAKIYINEEHHYGTEFSKSFEAPIDSAVKIEVLKQGYKKIRQEHFLIKDESFQFSLEKQTFSFSSILSEIQNKAIPYIHKIKPNFLNLFVFLKLNCVWAIDTLKLKLKKNQTDTVKLIQKKRNETKKAIDKSSETVKPHKKEYATYLTVIVLFFIVLYSLLNSDRDKRKTEEPPIFPTVNFESTEASGEESQSSVRIPVELSKESDSIVEIRLLFSGTANGNDYKSKSETLIIQSNKKIGFIDLNIFDDKVLESNESIEIKLENPVNAKLGAKQNYTYTIINDDKKTTIKTKPKKFPAKGSKYRKDCKGFDQFQYYHDGRGGYYSKLIKKNSLTCGFRGNTKKPNELSFYLKTIDEEDPNFYSEIFDDYFVIYNTVQRDITLKVYSVSKNQLIKNFEFKGRILNLYYDNKQIFTNKGHKADVLHHFIDIGNPSNSILKGALFRQRKYLGSGDEKKIIIKKN